MSLDTLCGMGWACCKEFTAESSRFVNHLAIDGILKLICRFWIFSDPRSIILLPVTLDIGPLVDHMPHGCSFIPVIVLGYENLYGGLELFDIINTVQMSVKGIFDLLIIGFYTNGFQRNNLLTKIKNVHTFLLHTKHGNNNREYTR